MLLYRVSTAFDDVSSNGLTATSFLFLEIDMISLIGLTVFVLMFVGAIYENNARLFDERGTWTFLIGLFLLLLSVFLRGE